MIRKAKKSELSIVHAINESFVPHVGRENLAWFEKYFELAEVFWVYESAGEIQAFLVAMSPSCSYDSQNFLWFKERYDHFVYIDRVAVNKKFQGHGIGKKLYQHLGAEWAERAETVACEVNVRPANPESYAFHQKMGFREVGQQETKGGTVRVAMLMRPTQWPK